jgi:hypothetical protein
MAPACGADVRMAASVPAMKWLQVTADEAGLAVH